MNRNVAGVLFMQRKKKEGTWVEDTRPWHSFFEAILSECPEVLDNLRDSALPPYQALRNRAPAEALRHTTWRLFKASDPEAAASRDAIIAWARRSNLKRQLDRVGQIAVEVLFELSANPEHHAKGLWWVPNPNTYVAQLNNLDLPLADGAILLSGGATAKILVRVDIPAFNPAIDKTPRRYSARVQAAVETAVEPAARVVAERLWVAATRESVPGHIFNQRTEDPRQYRAFARYICCKENAETIAQVFHVGAPGSLSTVYRWLNSAARALGVSIRKPGRPRRIPREIA